ncbi:MAG: response regulator, partial [Myxococcota bacterium]
AAAGLVALADPVKESTPDLVLADLDMPVMDGFELIEALRKDPMTSETPILVISTRGSDEDKARAMAAGADGYIVKLDFDETSFRQLLRRYLDE